MTKTIALPKHQLRLLSEVVLYKFYECHLDDNQKEKLSVEDIHRTFSVPVSRKLIQSAIEHLRSNFNEKLVIRSGTTNNYMFKISTDGIVFTENKLKQEGSLISYFSANGDDSLEEVAGFKAIYHIVGEKQAPDWISLTVNRETDEYKQMIVSLDASIEEIRKSNDFSSNYPEEKLNILASLEEGKKSLQSGAFTKSKILSLIASPLKWIATTFARTALQVAATDTIQRLIELLSSLQ